MIRYLSPLRYPGGKARLAPYLAALLRAQPAPPHSYAEPFAGGAGAALQLLASEYVSSIRINDLNPGIASFWRSVVNDPDEFARRVEAASVDLHLWHHSRELYLRAMDGEFAEDLELGFATFVLNRCNRSGILGARPIGGMQQDGPWRMDARFNRVDLAERIRRIGDYSSRIVVSELDARDFIAKIDVDSPDDTFLYVDPPYLGQGDALYMNSLAHSDHEQLAATLKTSRTRWMLTYDADPRVAASLYEGMRCLEFRIAHTAASQHVGLECVVYSRGLLVPNIDLLPQAEAEWISA